MNLTTTINPFREDGGMDHRFTGLTNEIVKRAGKECIEDLSRLYQYTNDAEARYEKAGLTLVTSFFQVDMEKWQRRTFLKRLRVCLQEIGFKPSKVSKLITAGEFLASELKRISCETNDWLESEEEFEARKKDEVKYLKSYQVSALYQVARMNWEGQAEARNSYAASQGQPLTVRELEKLQARYPAENSGIRSRKTKIKESVVEEGQTKELVSQLVKTVQAIDWASIQDDPESMDLLSSVELRIDHMAELVDQWKYAPVTLTSRHKQVELNITNEKPAASD